MIETYPRVLTRGVGSAHTKENSGSCRRKQGPALALDPRLTAVFGPARETGLAWKGKPGTRQECGPQGGAINSQRESESLQGRGCGEGAVGKETVSHQSREVQGTLPLCIELAGVRDHVFREEHEPPLYHLPTSLRKFPPHCSSPTLQVFGMASFHIFIPLGILEYEQ